MVLPTSHTLTASSFCLSLGVSSGKVDEAPSAEIGDEIQDVLRESESSLELGDKESRPER